MLGGLCAEIREGDGERDVSRGRKHVLQRGGRDVMVPCNGHEMQPIIQPAWPPSILGK